MKKLFVLGSNSFSGSNFIDLMLKKDFEIIGCSRSKEYQSVYLPYKKNNNLKKFKFFQLDINKDLEEIICMINKFKPEYIVNFLAQGMVAESWKSPTDWYETNLMAQVKFHDSIRNFAFIKKYLHFTTPEVYGSTSGWTKENYIFAPNSPYAVSRAACDLHLMSFYNNYNFPVVFTRAANVFGEHQQLYRIVPQTIMRILRGEKLDLHGGGLSERSFIHIDDVSAATSKALLKGRPGETYHISMESKLSIKELVIKICQILNVTFDDSVKISDERLGKDFSYALDSSKIRSEFNWEEKISLDKGIKKTISWVKENFESLNNEPLEYFHKK